MTTEGLGLGFLAGVTAGASDGGTGVVIEEVAVGVDAGDTIGLAVGVGAGVTTEVVARAELQTAGNSSEA